MLKALLLTSLLLSSLSSSWAMMADNDPWGRQQARQINTNRRTLNDSQKEKEKEEEKLRGNNFSQQPRFELCELEYSQTWQNLNIKVQEEVSTYTCRELREDAQKKFYRKWKEIAKRAREGDDKAIQKVENFKLKWEQKSKYRQKQESRIRATPKKIEGAIRRIGLDELFRTSETPAFIFWSAGLEPTKQPTSRLNSGVEIDWLDLQQHLRLPTSHQIYKTGEGHIGALHAGPSFPKRKFLTKGQHAAHKLRQDAINRSSSPATAVMRVIQAELESTANYQQMKECKKGYDYKGGNMENDEEWDDLRLEIILKRDGVKKWWLSFRADFNYSSASPRPFKLTPMLFTNLQNEPKEVGVPTIGGMPTLQDINNRAQYIKALGDRAVPNITRYSNAQNESDFSEGLETMAAPKKETPSLQRVSDSTDSLFLKFSELSLNNLSNSQERDPENYYYNLGMHYLNEKNYEEAVRSFRLAAEQGHADAQYNLGFSYAYGEGVLKDEGEAIKWFRLAADQEDTEALAELHKLTSRTNNGIPLQFKDKSRYTRDNLHNFLNYLHEELKSYKEIEYQLSENKFFLSATTIGRLCANKNHAPTKEYDDLWAALKITFKIEFKEWSTL